MTTEPTPVGSRRELAKLLRELRQQHRWALEDVYAETGISPGFLSRVERGLRGLGDAYAERLSDLYQVPPPTRSHIRQLARQGRRKSWWDEAGYSRTIKEYIGLEQSATAITIYGSIVPGLFQTKAYAEATTVSTAFEASADDRATAVEHRLRRQMVLNRSDPPWVHAVLDESALRRATGGAETLRGQLEALLVATERPRVTIQVIPFASGGHPGLDSRFVMVSTSEDHTPELVHVADLSGFRNFEAPKELGHFERAWRVLSAVALTPADSKDFIVATIERLDQLA